MGGKKRIKDMGCHKDINIKLREAPFVFENLGIDPETDDLMDVKKAIFRFYKIPDPEILVQYPQKTLSRQTPNNAYGIPITDGEMRIFMKIFNLSEDDFFQESIGGRIVSDIFKYSL